jgi:hypothetical protein
MEQKKFKLLG